MADSNPFSLTKPQPQSRLDTSTGKPEYVTSSGNITSSKAEAEQDAQGLGRGASSGKVSRPSRSSGSSSSSSSSSKPKPEPAPQKKPDRIVKLPGGQTLEFDTNKEYRQWKENERLVGIAKREQDDVKDGNASMRVIEQSPGKSDYVLSKGDRAWVIQGGELTRYSSDRPIRSAGDVYTDNITSYDKQRSSMVRSSSSPETPDRKPTLSEQAGFRKTGVFATNLLSSLEAERDMRRSELDNMSLEELRSEREMMMSEIQDKFYDTTPIFSGERQGTQYQTGTSITEKPLREGITIPFSERRIFESAESKEKRGKQSLIRDIDKRISDKSYGKFPESLPPAASYYYPEGYTGMMTSEGRSEYYRRRNVELEDSIRSKSDKISRRTGLAEPIILAPFGKKSPSYEVLSLGRELDANTKILSERNEVLSPELREPYEKLNFSDFKPTMTGATIPQKQDGPESIGGIRKKARRSIVTGATEDIALLALTAGISAGAVKLAATSPRLFKMVRAIDRIDDTMDILEVGSGVYSLATGDAPGAARNIGNIVTGNYFAGRASSRVARGLDFSKVAPRSTVVSRIQDKLFPVGVKVEGYGYDFPDSGRKPNWQEGRINQQLIINPETRKSIVNDLDTFQPEVVLSEVVESKTDAINPFVPSYKTSDRTIDPFIPSGSTAAPTLEIKKSIVKAKPQNLMIEGIIKDGKYKPARRNIPKEKFNEFLSDSGRVWRSKKASISAISAGSDVSSPGLGLDFTPETTTKITPETPTRTPISVRDDLGLKPDITSKATPSLKIESMFKSTGVIKTKLPLAIDKKVTPTIDPTVEPTPDYTSDPTSDYTSGPTTEPTPTSTITPSWTPSPTLKGINFTFTPKSPLQKLPRGRNILKSKGRKVKEWTVSNKILDITGSFRNIGKNKFNDMSTIRGKTKDKKGRIFNPKGFDARSKLKRFL